MLASRRAHLEPESDADCPDLKAMHDSAQPTTPDWSRRCGGLGALAALGLMTLGLGLAGRHEGVSIGTDGRVARAAPDRVDMRLNVNTANASALESLPQVGPALAGRIVHDRETNGAFESIADLQRVSGIGERTVERIAPFVRCD